MKANRPLVSVIVIFLNAEAFLEEAISSVLNQTYSHWELLLVDDGSTDASTGIAQRAAGQDPHRVRYLEHSGHQNLGMSASRNLGLRQASGAWIGFLDADDIWLPNKLQEQIGLLTTEPEAGMIYGRTLYWHSWTGRSKDRKRDRLQEHGRPANTLVRPPHLLIDFLQGRAAVPCISSILVRSETLRAVGGFEVAFAGAYEDQVLHAKICLETPVYVAQACWDQYRQHPHSYSYSSQAMKDSQHARERYLEWLLGYLDKKGFENSPVWRAALLERLLARNRMYSGLVRRARRLIRAALPAR